jgi:hypothetical protein
MSEQKPEQGPLGSIYNDLGLESQGVSYDQFEQKFFAEPGLQKSVYDDLGFESQGVSYDKYLEVVKKKEEAEPVSPTGSDPSQAGSKNDFNRVVSDLMMKVAQGDKNAQRIADGLIAKQQKKAGQTATQAAGQPAAAKKPVRQLSEEELRLVPGTETAVDRPTFQAPKPLDMGKKGGEKEILSKAPSLERSKTWSLVRQERLHTNQSSKILRRTTWTIWRQRTRK